MGTQKPCSAEQPADGITRLCADAEPVLDSRHVESDAFQVLLTLQDYQSRQRNWKESEKSAKRLEEEERAKRQGGQKKVYLKSRVCVRVVRAEDLDEAAIAR